MKYQPALSLSGVSFSKIAGCVALASVLASPLLARSFTAGDLTIGQPWARETAKGQSAGGGFLTVSNKGKQSDRLIGGSSPVAGEVQIHTMSMDGGVMRMRQLKNGIEIPAGKSITLKPGGYHLMLMGLKAPLKQGTRVPVTLTFQKAGKVKVELTVEPVGAMAPAGRS